MPTQRIPLTQPIESRTGSFAKDSYSSNCVFEYRDAKREFVKRPGLVMVKQITPVTPPATLQSQGLVGFNSQVISVISNNVYTTHPTTFVTSSVGTTSVSTSDSYFAKTFLEDYLFMHNKVNGYLYTQAGVFSVIVNDKVSNISVDNSGIQYSQGITLTFSVGVVAATANVSLDDGTITSVTVTNGSTGLAVAPTCTIVKPANATPTGTGSISLFTIVVSSAAGIYLGMYVSGTGVAPNAKVTNISSTTITVNIANAAAVSGTITFTDAGSNGVLTPALNSFPAGPYVSGAVFLNNYIFVGTTDSRIYNCDVGDPTTWGALNYISFEQTADSLVAIAKHLNYLIAFGRVSMQFFYDSANATGSPLSVSQSYTSEVGCANGDSIVSTDNTCLWIGISKSFGKSVFLLDGVSPVRVSTSSIDKHLEGDSLDNVSAYVYKFYGHTLYILTLHDSNKTLVYDINEKMWYTWTQYAMASDDQDNPGTMVESYFRPTFYADVAGVPFALDDDTAELYYFSTTAYEDDGESIYCRIVTDLVDNGTTKRKFYGRLEIIGDKISGGVMQIRHTGNDYVTWSTYRNVDLNLLRPVIYLGGADRRRAWEFLCTSNVPLRIDAAEVDFRVGELDQEQDVGGGAYRR